MPVIDRIILTPWAVRCLVLICLIVSGLNMYPGPGACRENEEKLDFTLPAPDNDVHRQYLGLLNNARFSLGQIRAEIVIIEIFSMYCPICQREAANVNTLFRLIQNSPSLKNKVRLIGIGAGNSAFEVEFFKKKYAVEFPLFSDPDFSIHKKTGEVRTPHFFGLALQGNGNFNIFYSQSGELSNPEKFLETLLKNSGIKKQP